MGIPLGTAVPNLTWLIRDDQGTAVDPTAVTLTIQRPDGISSSVSTDHINVGVYAATYIPAVAGRYTFRWKATGDVVATYSDLFDVDDALSNSLVSVDEAAAHLRMQALFIRDDGEREKLRQMCRAATGICEKYIRSPIAVQQFTENFDGGRDVILLSRSPIVEVLAVTEAGLDLSETDYQIDAKVAAIYRGQSGEAFSWAVGRQNLSVTYTAGYPDPPDDLRLAVLREVEHLWQRTQNMPHPGMADDSYDEMMVRDTFSAIPSPVRYILDPYKLGGFA